MLCVTENIPAFVALNYTSNPVHCKAASFKHLNGKKPNIAFLNVGKEVDMKEREKKSKISNEERLFQCAESLEIGVNPTEKDLQVKGRRINH